MPNHQDKFDPYLDAGLLGPLPLYKAILPSADHFVSNV